MLLAVAVTLATPRALVSAVALERIALAPTVGTENVTVAPLTTIAGGVLHRHL